MMRGRRGRDGGRARADAARAVAAWAGRSPPSSHELPVRRPGRADRAVDLAPAERGDRRPHVRRAAHLPADHARHPGRQRPRAGGAGRRGTGTARPTGGRTGRVERSTRETQIDVGWSLDGSGRSRIATGIGFLDHMLTALAFHSLIDIDSTCTGDLWVDEHHTVEDVAIALGQALDRALGDRAGIAPLRRRAGAAGRGALPRHRRPGRPRHAAVDLPLRGARVGGLPASLVPHFVDSLSRSRTAGDPPAGARARTTTTWSRRRSRRWRWPCARRSRPTPAGPGRCRARRGRCDATVTLIDYGAGNLRSLRAAFERLGATVQVSGDPDRGGRRRAAGAARRRRGGAGDGGAARAAGSTAPLAASTAPLLGVCLGMQLLFERQRRGRRRMPGPAGRRT